MVTCKAPRALGLFVEAPGQAVPAGPSSQKKVHCAPVRLGHLEAGASQLPSSLAPAQPVALADTSSKSRQLTRHTLSTSTTLSSR
jgi:hypothetical protein